MKIGTSVFFLLLLSCSTAKQDQRAETEAPPAPQILFLNYKAYRSPDGTSSVNLLSKIVTNGKIKGESSMESNLPSAWLCIQFDGNNKALDQKVIPNPLHPTVEFVNDAGELQTKTIAIDSIEFSVRMQLKPGTRNVVLTTNGGIDKPLLKVDL